MIDLPSNKHAQAQRFGQRYVLRLANVKLFGTRLAIDFFHAGAGVEPHRGHHRPALGMASDR